MKKEIKFRTKDDIDRAFAGKSQLEQMLILREALSNAQKNPKDYRAIKFKIPGEDTVVRFVNVTLPGQEAFKTAVNNQIKLLLN